MLPQEVRSPPARQSRTVRGPPSDGSRSAIERFDWWGRWTGAGRSIVRTDRSTMSSSRIERLDTLGRVVRSAESHRRRLVIDRCDRQSVRVRTSRGRGPRIPRSLEGRRRQSRRCPRTYRQGCNSCTDTISFTFIDLDWPQVTEIGQLGQSRPSAAECARRDSARFRKRRHKC